MPPVKKKDRPLRSGQQSLNEFVKKVSKDTPQDTLKKTKKECVPDREVTVPRPKEVNSETVFDTRLDDQISEPVSMLDLEEQDSELSTFGDDSLTASVKMHGSQRSGDFDKLVKMLSVMSEKLEKLGNVPSTLDKIVADQAEIKKDMAEIKRDILGVQRQLSDVKNRVESLEESRRFDSEQIEELKTQTMPDMEKSLRGKIGEMEDRVLNLETYERQRNVVVTGIPETREENPDQLIREFFSSKLRLSKERASSMKFFSVHRLQRTRRPEDPQSDDPRIKYRPMMITFQSLQDRDEVLSARKNLQGEKIKMKVDLPPSLRRERSRLEAEAYRMRVERKQWARVVVRGTSIMLQTYSQRNQKWETVRI